MWRLHLFPPRESHGRTLASRASSPHLSFHDRMTRQWRAFFLRCRAVATAVARAASRGTIPVNAHLQSDGADLSPANLSRPGVYSFSEKP